MGSLSDITVIQKHLLTRLKGIKEDKLRKLTEHELELLSRVPNISSLYKKAFNKPNVSENIMSLIRKAVETWDGKSDLQFHLCSTHNRPSKNCVKLYPWVELADNVHAQHEKLVNKVTNSCKEKRNKIERECLKVEDQIILGDKAKEMLKILEKFESMEV